MDKYIISLSMPSINHQIYIHTHKHTYIYIYITVTKSPCFVYESWEIFKKVLTKSKLDLVFGFIRKKYVLIGNIKKKKKRRRDDNYLIAKQLRAYKHFIFYLHTIVDFPPRILFHMYIPNPTKRTWKKKKSILNVIICWLFEMVCFLILEFNHIN